MKKEIKTIINSLKLNEIQEVYLYAEDKLKELANKEKHHSPCQMCDKDTVVYDGMDRAGHMNYICTDCGEPQDD